MIQDDQPGDPEQLCRAVRAAERWYEETRRKVIVFWSETENRYSFNYQSDYDAKDSLEVVRIPS